MADKVTFRRQTKGLGGYSFRGYNNPDTGEEVSIVIRTTKEGDPVFYRPTWEFGEIDISIPKRDKRLIDFITNAPMCKQSPYNKGAWHYERLPDDEEEAEARVAQKTIVNQAQARAIDLFSKPDLLKKVAVMCAYLGSNEKMQQSVVMDFSESDPVGFTALLESPELPARALLRMAVEARKVHFDGVCYKFGSPPQNIGVDESQAVASMMRDADLMSSISHAMDNSLAATPKFAPPEVSVKKGPFGRPVKPVE